MATEVFDYRTDVANLFVHPEIRARIMRMEPAPAGRMHSHDLGGEIFLVLQGQCEFLIEEERVTCGPGQLIYVDPNVKHTLHAVGDEPCYVYLSVTPHVEPTHTQYDENGRQLPPNYGTWRGGEHADPNPEVATPELARRYVDAAKKLS
jgi:quercetin dioxygenase-like cupin family protein